MWNIIYKLASPCYFYDLAGKIIPWAGLICLGLFGYGLMGGLLLAPPDYQQGDAFRIIYIHVPSAFMSLMIFVTMAIASTIHLVWKIKIADVVAKVSAPLGASFAFLALVTGSLWGKPMWGTWWIWDARLTSELILLFLYFGVIALRSAVPDRVVAAKVTAILTLVGVVDIPIIHYSVYWWNTLHQKSTILAFQKPSIAPGMLYPLIAMLCAFMLYFLTIMLMFARNEVLAREKGADWVHDLLEK